MHPNEVSKLPPEVLDAAFLEIDKRQVRRTRNLRLIPIQEYRKGGKSAAIEWAHVVGIFQTLLYMELNGKPDSTILDVGCGTGLLAIASEPFVSEGGLYLGIDVSLADIEFCRGHYTNDWFQFQHLSTHNAFYTAEETSTQAQWDVADATQDMVTALSVWTHLNEKDATFYFREINRVLKPGGKAIITFFLLDALYEASLSRRTDGNGRYHLSSQKLCVFDRPAYESKNWYYRKGVNVPENAIGVREAGLDQLIEATDLSIVARYPGNWKEIPGIFYQDVIIFEKKTI